MTNAIEIGGIGWETRGMTHCEMLQAGEIQVVVGDSSRDGVGGQQYCGLWSLTSRHRQFNAFGNSYAGLIPGAIRRPGTRLEAVSDTACSLVGKVDSDHSWEGRAVYEVKAPYYVDHVFTLVDREDQRVCRSFSCPAGEGDYREVSWCCYINCPDDPSLHMISNGEWISYMSPEHGVGSSIAPSYVPDEELEIYPEVKEKRPFHWDRVDFRFDRPFYYGRLGKMVLILVFDRPRWLRFFCSPSGGGESLLPGRTCPAWDFMWVIPGSEYRIGREYEFRVRLVYKPYESDDDVLAEVLRAQGELGFEAV